MQLAWHGAAGAWVPTWPLSAIALNHSRLPIYEQSALHLTYIVLIASANCVWETKTLTLKIKYNRHYRCKPPADHYAIDCSLVVLTVFCRGSQVKLKAHIIRLYSRRRTRELAFWWQRCSVFFFLAFFVTYILCTYLSENYRYVSRSSPQFTWISFIRRLSYSLFTIATN